MIAIHRSIALIAAAHSIIASSCNASCETTICKDTTR